MPSKLDSSICESSKIVRLEKPDKKRAASSDRSEAVSGELPVISELLEQIGRFAPHLSTLLQGPRVDLKLIPLDHRTTDDLVQLIEFGWCIPEIATIWGVDPGRLICWTAADGQRSARAHLARLSQAEIWDRVAFAIGLFTPSDRVEMMRAKLLMEHCKWRASKYDPGRYGNRLLVKKTVGNQVGSDLTTAELQRIAAGGIPPAGM